MLLSSGSYEHIKNRHPEIEVREIRQVLKDPDEVWKSSKRSDSELYYLLKKKNRYICIVVKICPDGNFISTAMTTSKPKAGQLVYRREVE